MAWQWRRVCGVIRGSPAARQARLQAFCTGRCVQRLVGILAREHPLRRPRFAPVGTQFFQESGGEWHQPFLLTLAQHPHHHTAAVDLSGGQVQGFADPQPGGVDGPQHNPDNPVMHGVEEEGHLLG